MAVTNASATAYSNQKLGLTLSTGRLVTVYSDTGTNAIFKYSDTGQTWTNFSADILGWSNGSIAAYVDTGGTERIVAVWQQSGTGGGRTADSIYIMCGAFNAGRTTITWSTAVTTGGASTAYRYPDVAITPDGTGGAGQLVWSYFDGTNAYGAHSVPITITSAGVVTAGSLTLHGNGGASYTGISTWSFPSVDINLSDKRIHLSWSGAKAGAGFGIRYRTASYSAGVWTWATEVEVDNTAYYPGTDYCTPVRWDGTRAVIGGMANVSAVAKIVIYDSTSFTAFTNRVTSASLALVDQTNNPGMAVDTATGDPYVFGTAYNGGYHDIVYYKAARSGTALTLGSKVITDAVAAPSAGAFPNAWFSGSTVRWIYTAGNNSPYQVKYDQLILNQTPNVPTAVGRVAPLTATTPTFTAAVSDPDTAQQIKARFQLYQSDGTTLVGTVDSSFRTGAGTVTAVYSSALGIGTYKLQAATVDDVGAISAYSAQVTIYVLTSANKDSIYVWNVLAQAVKDSVYIWAVQSIGTKDSVYLWNVVNTINKDSILLWLVNDPWTLVPLDDVSTGAVWTEVLSS